MPRRSPKSIPHELHQIKARQIYEQRIAKGIDGNPEDDWEQARIKLNCWDVTAWKIKQLFRSGCRRLWQSFKALINGIWKIITFPFWLFYKLPQLFANADTKPFALDVVKTIISAASLIAAIIAAIGLFVNYHDALKDRELTQERLVTDRFTKAVEQLGNDKEEVIIGGIYSLERIAKDSPKDQWTIMEVLTAFVRKNSPIPTEIQNLRGGKERVKALAKLEPVNIQVQAALTVIGRRDPEQDYTSDEVSKLNTKKLDLSNSNLRTASLRGAFLSDMDFWGANFSTASLNFANLNTANLSTANLSFAFLSNANLSFAFLWGADLSFAFLSDADLTGAFLWGADLSGAKDLSNKQIKSACFWEQAIYIDSKWNKNANRYIAVDKKANQKKIEAIKQDKASDPENPPDCNRWKLP
jgi:uncharacterized protein YjbI with pentapeptide repeats